MLTLAALLATAGIHHRGAGPAPDRGRAVAFAAGLVALAVALASPLEDVAAATMTGHSVQHLLLMLVAAPLLAAAEPGGRLMRGLPRSLRRGAVRARLGVGATAPRRRWLHHPAVAFAALVLPMWLWHAAALHEAALVSLPVHLLEHATLLGGAWVFWHAIVHAVRRDQTAVAVGLLFLGGVQGVLLTMLMLFSGTAWYPAYADGAAAWGLSPLTDQQLGGLLLWLPASLVYVSTAIAIIARALRTDDHDSSPVISAA